MGGGNKWLDTDAGLHTYPISHIGGGGLLTWGLPTRGREDRWINIKHDVRKYSISYICG